MQQYGLSLIFTVLAIIGLFLLFRVPFAGYFNKWSELLQNRQKRSKTRRNEIVKGKKKVPPLILYFREAKKILTQSGKEIYLPLANVSMVVLFVAGIILSFAADNILLLPVLTIGLSLLPMAFVHSKKASFMRQFNGNMKSALGVITNTYIQTEDIVSSTLTNLRLLKPPFNDVFSEFAAEANYIESNIPKAISKMKLKIDNRIFKEWCDVLIQCNDNNELKYVLPLIVEKNDEIISVQTELDTKNAPEISNYRAIFIIDILTLPLMFLIERPWYDQLAASMIGKFVIALAAALSLISLFYSIKDLNPIEYL
jgi:hypothetical protein